MHHTLSVTPNKTRQQMMKLDDNCYTTHFKDFWDGRWQALVADTEDKQPLMICCDDSRVSVLRLTMLSLAFAIFIFVCLVHGCAMTLESPYSAWQRRLLLLLPSLYVWCIAVTVIKPSGAWLCSPAIAVALIESVFNLPQQLNSSLFSHL